MSTPTDSFRSIHGAAPWFGDRIDAICADIRAALEAGRLAQGPQLEAFEQAFAEHVGVRHALGVTSGGIALELALRALDVRGKEVIVPTDTFVASANAVIQAGGEPIFADVKRDTLCLDPEDVARRITPRTAGIMFVHMFGLVPPDVHAIASLCRERGLFLIEDAAHAHGAACKGVPAGRIGDVACFSFFATKNLTTGEGGMITTQRDDLRDRIDQLRNHGRSLTQPVYEIPSNNYRLAELPAILGVHQVAVMDQVLTHRNRIAQVYRQGLAEVPGLTLLPAHADVTHSYWRFPAYLDGDIDRSAFQQRVAQRYGIRITWMYEPLCHQQPVFTERAEQPPLPVAERCMRELICLPTHGHVSEDDARFICEALRSELCMREAA